MKAISPRVVVKQKETVAPAPIRRGIRRPRTRDDEGDLSQFVLGFMGEVLLSATIADQARLQERALVLDLWSQSANFAQVGATARTGPGGHRPLPTKPLTPEHGAPPPVPNTLPPPFFFSAPELFYIQNILRAVVIAAALLPTKMAEDARLINLAELVHASSLVDDEAGKLRAAARTRRLLSTLAERLARAPTAPVHRKDAPTEMCTGRREQTTLNVTSEERTEVEVLDVKGFGDPVLTGAIKEGLKKLRTAVRWIEGIWADTVAL
ncbi:hypothetical protein EDB85DRAFT_2144032 [Lactarius pseudohatsudake]|nr:hypothetical protein EDB85DRAFT_2144032 [Lactarius pseudohatsudake]